ncbi:MAG: phage tail protein [Actinomycetota bacterium]|nr:phage tail protein [Actinomycetota bacterium]
MSDPAVSVCFVVSVDGQELGNFTSCEGLACEITIETREEGGNNGFIYQLPGRMKYTNVKFSRPINADSSKVASWMTSMVTDIKRHTATIEAMTADGDVVCKWDLDMVIPVKWQGPQFNVDSPKVAMETIELAYHGFVQGA